MVAVRGLAGLFDGSSSYVCRAAIAVAVAFAGASRMVRLEEDRAALESIPLDLHSNLWRQLVQEI